MGKTEPQIASQAFVYFGSYVEEENVVGLFTLGTTGQMPDDRDFTSINGDFGWLLFYLLGCDRYHEFVSLSPYTSLPPGKKVLLFIIMK